MSTLTPLLGLLPKMAILESKITNLEQIIINQHSQTISMVTDSMSKTDNLWLSINGNFDRISSEIKNKSAIKSIQRGTVNTMTYPSAEHTINIATVDPAKCEVLVSPNIDTYGYNGALFHSCTAKVANITANSIVVSASSAINRYVHNYSWQVIEYY